MKRLAFLCVFLAFAVPAIASDSVMIVLDTSGSMADYMRSARKSKMVVAQDALVEVLANVPDTTKVGILTFNGWIYDIDKVDRARLEAAIRQTRPAGGTPLYEFMRAGATRLLEEREKQLNVGSYKLLVISDGEAGDRDLNEDSRFPDGSTRPGVLADILSRNITVDTIALDMADDHPLQHLINGTYMRGDDPASLKKAVSQAVAEVGFGDSKDASAEAFADIVDLPVGAVKPILAGLTKFPNYPIGEKAPVPVVRADGTVGYAPAPGNVAVAAPGTGGMSGISICLIVLGVAIGAILLAFIIAAICNSGDF